MARSTRSSPKQVGEGAHLPNWVQWWAVIASVLVTLDCLYVFKVAYGSYFKQLLPSFINDLWTWYGESDVQYSASGQGMANSNGWVITQSKFNTVEVACQLAFLFLPRGSADALLFILFGSICTLWKTLLYMSIIIHSSDPVAMVPLLACFGYEALPENKSQVSHALKQDSCLAHAFKFQFNFWWIIVPAVITVVVFDRIRTRFRSKTL